MAILFELKSFKLKSLKHDVQVLPEAVLTLMTFIGWHNQLKSLGTNVIILTIIWYSCWEKLSGMVLNCTDILHCTALINLAISSYLDKHLFHPQPWLQIAKLYENDMNHNLTRRRAPIVFSVIERSPQCAGVCYISYIRKLGGMAQRSLMWWHTAVACDFTSPGLAI